MQSFHSDAAAVEADEIEFRMVRPHDPELENRVVSPCGRFESFDYKGGHFEIDWNEIIGDDEEEEIPHEQVMAELDQHLEELRARRRRER